MKQIIAHLWFDKEAEEAVNFYTSVFPNSEIKRKSVLEDTPSGDALSIDFVLENLSMSAINGGPLFQLNPSISIMVAVSEPDEVDELYNQLSEGGQDLMPLDKYPFSERYAWVQDRYGLSWQLMVDPSNAAYNKLRISLLFSGEACGKAEEALKYYQQVFNQAEIANISNYQEGEATDKRAKINFSEFIINNQKLVLMDHGMGGDFNFNEAFSLLIFCGSQAEIDYYWDKLSHVPEAEQCGWVKDQFGVSWQIVPIRMIELLDSGTEEEIQRVTQAMLKMKKLDIEALENAKYGI